MKHLSVSGISSQQIKGLKAAGAAVMLLVVLIGEKAFPANGFVHMRPELQKAESSDCKIFSSYSYLWYFAG